MPDLLKYRTVFLIVSADGFGGEGDAGLEGDAVDAFALAAVGHVGVDLGGFHVLVAEHMLHGVDARPCLHLQRPERVPRAMKGDVFGDSGCLQPLS